MTFAGVRCARCDWTPSLQDAAALLRRHHVDVHGLAEEPGDPASGDMRAALSRMVALTDGWPLDPQSEWADAVAQARRALDRHEAPAPEGVWPPP